MRQVMRSPTRCVPRSAGALRLALALLLLASAVAASAAPLWEVRGDGGFLLGGTIHMLRPDDLPPPAAFEDAYATTGTVVLEADLGALAGPEMQRLVLERGLYPPGQNLADAVTEDTWERLVVRAGELHIPVEMLERMRPSLAGLTLARAQLARLGVTEMGIDGYFYGRARADGRPVIGLESADEQMSMLLGLGEADADRFLLASLDDLDRSAVMLDDVVARWREGDLETLHARLIEPSREQDPESFAALFSDRNAAWLPRLAGFADSAERELVLVGAGHLGGSDGLLQALRDAGYSVTRWSGQ